MDNLTLTAWYKKRIKIILPYLQFLDFYPLIPQEF